MTVTYMKCLFAAILAALLLVPAPALAEGAAFYEGPVLTFSAPRDAELILNDMTSDSYVQGLYSAGSGEVIVSAAFATADERDACLASLLGEFASAAAPDENFDSVRGHGAQRLVTAAEFTGREDLAMTPFTEANELYIVSVVTVDAGRAYLFAAAMPESAYYGEGLGEVVEAQIESLDIFDPDAKIMLVPETDEPAAYNLMGDVVQDAEAGAFLVYALDAISGVRLSTVTMKEDGSIAPDAPLGEWSAMDFGDAIRIRAYLPDVLPGFAVSFTGSDGVETTLYVTMSGIDGTLLLVTD